MIQQQSNDETLRLRKNTTFSFIDFKNLRMMNPNDTKITHKEGWCLKIKCFRKESFHIDCLLLKKESKPTL